MNACYYTHCPSCGAVALETTLEKLRDELAQHIRAEHLDVSVTTRLLDHVMQEAVYYPGSQESKEPPATPVSTESILYHATTCPACSLSFITSAAVQEPQATLVPNTYTYHYFKCPCCPHVTMESTYTKMHKVALAHIDAEHPEGSRDRADALRALRGTTPFSTCRTSAEPVPTAPKEAYVVTDDPENPVVPLGTTLPKNQWDLNGAMKPPLGIQSEHQWHEQRMYELIACINRYHESGFPVKPEWLEELRSILVASRFLSVLKETK